MEPTHEPQRRHVLLVADGAEFATPHSYKRTEIKPDKTFGMLRPSHYFIFADDVTGAEKIFGCEGDPVPEPLMIDPVDLKSDEGFDDEIDPDALFDDGDLP